MPRKGLTKQTYFYGPAIAVARQNKLGASHVNLRARLPEVCASVKGAIGYRSKPRYDVARGTGSLRRAIVEVNDKLAAPYQTQFFAILTKHEYSSKGRYQVLAPLYDVHPQVAREPIASTGMPLALREFFAKSTTNLYVPSELVRSFWEEKAIIRVTDRTLDAPFLEKIEDAACAHLSL